ncbi:unnamed protein product [Vicia faba]|uniref:Uncharacterized protein n=1 Tax=Vicia faba TaxID=3906 RepID=A0AAV1AM86_VICFA|nr:unnamed protein product [Vicia faba]
MGLRILGTGSLHGETPIVVNRMVAIDLHNPPSEQVDSSPSLIPVSIGSLQNLVVLMLEENKLNGTQQDSLGQLTKLSYLDVSSNQLTDTVTEEHFSMLAKLKIVVIRFKFEHFWFYTKLVLGYIFLINVFKHVK